MPYNRNPPGCTGPYPRKRKSWVYTCNERFQPFASSLQASPRFLGRRRRLALHLFHASSGRKRQTRPVSRLGVRMHINKTPPVRPSEVLRSQSDSNASRVKRALPTVRSLAAGYPKPHEETPPHGAVSPARGSWAPATPALAFPSWACAYVATTRRPPDCNTTYFRNAAAFACT